MYFTLFRTVFTSSIKKFHLQYGESEKVSYQAGCLHVQVTEVLWSEDGSTLASASLDQSVRLWAGQKVLACQMVLSGHTGLFKILFLAPYSPDTITSLLPTK